MPTNRNVNFVLKTYLTNIEHFDNINLDLVRIVLTAEIEKVS